MCSSELCLPRKRSVWTPLLRLKPWCFSLVAEHWLWHVTVLCGAQVNATYWIVRQEITRPLALSDRSSGSVSQDSRSRPIGCISVWYPVFVNVASSRCGFLLDIVGSIPDEFIGGFFYWFNPSGRTMALVSTQLVTEMSIRVMGGGVMAAGA
jgi:hypothetical protein